MPPKQTTAETEPGGRASLAPACLAGNVRELENAVALARGQVLTSEELLLDEPMGTDAEPSKHRSLQEPLDHADEQRIRRALEHSSGRRAEAAGELGIDRTTLFRWMKRLGVKD